MENKTPANWVKQVGPFSISEKGAVKVEMIVNQDEGQEARVMPTFFRDYRVLEFILDNHLACREFIAQAKVIADKHYETKAQAKVLKKLQRAGLSLEDLQLLMGK